MWARPDIWGEMDEQWWWRRKDFRNVGSSTFLSCTGYFRGSDSPLTERQFYGQNVNLSGWDPVEIHRNCVILQFVIVSPGLERVCVHTRGFGVYTYSIFCSNSIPIKLCQELVPACDCGSGARAWLQVFQVWWGWLLPWAHRFSVCSLSKELMRCDEGVEVFKGADFNFSCWTFAEFLLHITLLEWSFSTFCTVMGSDTHRELCPPWLGH